MKFSMQLPAMEIEPAGEFQTAEAVRQIATTMESCGVDACWVTDHPAPAADWLRDPRGHDAIDPFVALSMAAAYTTRLQLHINLLVLPYRNPFLTAKSVASLEVLSGSRTILGVGSGYLEGEFSALGVDFRKRGKLTDEALETMMLAWSGEDVVKQGMNFDARGNLARPFPPRKPTIWIGGVADKSLERVVKWGNGWLPIFGPSDPGEFRKAQKLLSSLDDLKARVEQLHEMLEAAGRTDPVDICVNLPMAIGEASASEAQRVLDAVSACREAGATWVFAGLPHPSRSALLENHVWFGEEVISKAR
ncbi:MAG: TIGR03619 family F420-dependent LLM class oxidoreductase [Novosphingobium sp.]|nr:TIGR03619 family F420-dependent LLM class oxidoreductase [Novosphingobium sp.]